MSHRLLAPGKRTAAREGGHAQSIGPSCPDLRMALLWGNCWEGFIHSVSYVETLFPNVTTFGDGPLEGN